METCHSLRGQSGATIVTARLYPMGCFPHRMVINAGVSDTSTRREGSLSLCGDSDHREGGRNWRAHITMGKQIQL